MLAAANRSAIAQLRRQELLTATPAQLTVKLFHRLLLDLNRAAADLAAGNTGSASANLVHAQAIISELDATLDVAAWPGAEDLKSVYGYCLQTLDTANRDSNPEAVATAIDLMTPVAEAFEQAAKTA